ncbi:MAG TPA: hypothetical protein VNH19_06635 [Candidatus Limnocylindrales bacterium]|nr:hypothetical protein [Candidatus Limnocylindrales bacterium]
MNKDNELRMGGSQQPLTIPCRIWQVDPRTAIEIKRPHRLILPTNQYNSMNHLERMLEDDFTISLKQPSF